MKHGIEFPFNQACFKHDRLYREIPTLREKLRIDYVFYKDMMKLIEPYKGQSIYSKLTFRAKLFYIIVTLMTPVYVKQKKIIK